MIAVNSLLRVSYEANLWTQRAYSDTGVSLYSENRVTTEVCRLITNSWRKEGQFQVQSKQHACSVCVIKSECVISNLNDEKET